MELIPELKERARKFTEDNFSEPTPMHHLVIETAMLIGASIQTEVNIAQEIAARKKLTKG